MKLFSPMEPSSACSYVATQRGGVALLFEGHRYNKVRDGKDGTVYWRCSRDRQCPGRAVTVNNRVKKSNNKHNHPPEASLLMRNGGNGHSASGHHHSGGGHHHSNSSNSAMAAAAAAAAAYASFLQGSNNSTHLNSGSKSSSQQASSPLVATSAQSRPPPRNSPSTASSSSPSPLGLAANLGPVPGGNPFSAFSFLHNLAANAGSPNANHLLNNSLLSNHSSTDNGRQSALNLSNHGANHNSDTSPSNTRLPFNHLSNFNLFNHRNPLDSPAKLTPNSPPPTPTTNHSAMFAKSLHSQYSSLLKGPFNHTTSNSTNSSNSTLDLSPRSFSFGQSNQVPTNLSTANQSLNLKTETAATPPPTATTPNHHDNMAAFMLQDALQEAQAAAMAAAAFPSLLTETFKYLAAAAATNPQMAAALAANLSSPSMLKNFDLTMATAAAAAVAAAANQNNNNNTNSNVNNGARNGDSVDNGKSLGDHSPFAALRELSGGPSLRNDLDTSFHAHHDEQPLNMALNDRGNILKLLRTLMRAGGIPARFGSEPVGEPFHALVVPTADAHGSEYIAPCDARREFLSNFTGSAGTAVVTLKEAALWTDGRYFLQADAQLEKSSWVLMKDRQPGTLSIGEWLNKVLTSGSRVGADPYTMSFEGWRRLEEELSQYGNQLVQTPVNLVDEVWTRRPPRPTEPVVPLDLNFTGSSWQDKVTAIRLEMNNKDAKVLVLTALDDIAWLLNLRGSDIEFNPVFFAYTVITMDKTYLFIDDSKLTPATLNLLQASNGLGDPMDTMSSPSDRSSPSASSLTGNGSAFSPQSLATGANNNLSSSTEIEIRSYELVADFIRSYISKNSTGRVWISNKSSYALVNLIPESRRVLTAVSPVTCKKAIKNAVEINGMRRAHIKDAVALCEFFAWLEDEVVHHGGRARKGSNPGASPSSSSSSSSLSSGTSATVIDELSVDAKLEEFRRQQDDYIGPSFQTIPGSGPNGAVIHYHCTEETNRPITTEEMFLLDTGAQFRDGTTDITRTVHLGTPTAHERECFTRVVKGHISLATARFPRLVKGEFLDSFARRALWDAGLDYNHGTGHGVGSYLNVHEGPSGIANRVNMDDPGIVEDMIFSNEPGYYEAGKFGIRIESLVVTKKVNLKFNFNDRGYLGFETISLVPIQTKLLDPSLMTAEEIEWIDQYHQQCRDLVGRELEQQGRTRAMQWLLKETEPVG